MTQADAQFILFIIGLFAGGGLATIPHEVPRWVRILAVLFGLIFMMPGLLRIWSTALGV